MKRERKYPDSIIKSLNLIICWVKRNIINFVKCCFWQILNYSDLLVNSAYVIAAEPSALQTPTSVLQRHVERHSLKLEATDGAAVRTLVCIFLADWVWRLSSRARRRERSLTALVSEQCGGEPWFQQTCYNTVVWDTDRSAAPGSVRLHRRDFSLSGFRREPEYYHGYFTSLTGCNERQICCAVGKMDSHPGFARWGRNLNKETVSHLYYRVYKRLSFTRAAQQADREGLYSHERKPDCFTCYHPSDAILAFLRSSLSYRGINQRYRTYHLSHELPLWEITGW